MIEYLRNVEGLEYVRLSAADLYARINGGVDRGSMLPDAMREVSERGVGTAATSGERWRSGEYRGPASADERSRFRVLELTVCPTEQHMLSAVCGGFGVISGILWYDSYTPDSEGWLPTQGRGRPGGHAIFGHKATKRGSLYGVWHRQSWGEQWGFQAGNFAIPVTAYRNGSIGGWWAARTVTVESSDFPAPKP